MSFGLSSTGLTIKRLPDIIASMNQKLQDRFGASWGIGEDSLSGFMVGTYAAECADLWEAVQGVYNASNPLTASGNNLDLQADNVGVKRIGANPSTAILKVNGAVGAVLASGSVVTVNPTNDRFITSTVLTLTSSVFNEMFIGVSVLANSTAYAVTINGVLCSYTSDSTATIPEIIAGLGAAITTAAGSVVTVSYPDANTLEVALTNRESELPIVIGTGLTILSVSRLIQVTSEATGAIAAPAGTLTQLLVPSYNINYVTNDIDASLGNDAESDSALRIRRYESVSVIGAGTLESIAAAVSNLDGVLTAFVIENETTTTDGAGRPAKSFEVVVEGGDDQAIAQMIWEKKPVGIQTWGSISKVVTDSNGGLQTVNFSRPTNVYIYVQLNYSLYSEEAFPSNAVATMKQAIVDFGNSLAIGEDVIPQRFYGSIYSAVTGLSTLTMSIAKSYDNITIGSYTTSPIAIGQEENTVFVLTAVNCTQV